MMKESYNYVICENENQAYDIRLTFKKQSKNSALKVPKIETLDIWLANAYQDYLLNESTHKELYLLNGIEEKIIWEKIIKNDLKKRQDNTVSDITNIAQQAINANRNISTYEIDEAELKQNITYKEPKYFLEWRQNFKKECVEKNLVTKYDFISIFNNLQQDRQIIKDEKILFINLDTNKKSHQKLFNQLKQVNIVTNDLDENKSKAHVNYQGYQNYEHEISAVIKWIKDKLSKNQQKLLIMSPALEKFQVKLQNEIDRNIQPIIFKDIRSESVTNSSLKRSLSAEPIIRAALILIKLNEEKLIPIKEICEILLFNNWIDNKTVISREYLAHQLTSTKKKYISLFELQNLLKTPLHISQDEDRKILQDTFNIIQNNRKNWHKKREIFYWGELIIQYLKKLNFGQINNLLYFENNNLKYFFKVINYIN